MLTPVEVLPVVVLVVFGEDLQHPLAGDVMFLRDRFKAHAAVPLLDHDRQPLAFLAVIVTASSS